MSKRKKKDKPETDAAASTELEEPAPGDAEAPPETPQAEETPAERIETLHEENLRLMAELRNVRQRAQREKEEALKYAEADFARELLVVLDDLERTLASIQSAGNVQAVAEGVRIVYEHFLKVLRAHQIEPIEALGKAFDPDCHAAMMQQPSEEHPPGTVMQELARGYRMHGRVIRPSNVVVSSGPPAPPQEQETPEEKGESDADI